MFFALLTLLNIATTPIHSFAHEARFACARKVKNPLLQSFINEAPPPPANPSPPSYPYRVAVFSISPDTATLTFPHLTPREEVMTENPVEIPQAVRDVSEQGLKQARAAYEQLTDFMTKAMGAWTDALPSNPMAAVFKDVQGRAMKIAMENAESVFTFAGKISNVRTPQDIVTLETQFAQDRMQAFVTQTQQLFSVIAEAIKKSERGPMAAGMGATTSNLMTAGFKDVQDRAVAIAKKNAESESALALVEKIAKAQNFQEILTLQARFAQEQMEAYATQMLELQRLIGDALQKSGRG